MTASALPLRALEAGRVIKRSHAPFPRALAAVSGDGLIKFFRSSQLRRIKREWAGKLTAAEVERNSSMVPLLAKIVDFKRILNAQLRLRGRAVVPLSVRLRGRLELSGSGNVVLDEGVSLNGTVVPIELVTYTSGRIDIGSHAFINYGSSIAARDLVKIGSHCLLGRYTL